MLYEKCGQVTDTIAEDDFQNQAYLDYAAFDSYLNKATTFNSATNTIADKTFNIIRNPVYPDSITCDSYFDRPMALNTIADGIIASTNFDIIPSHYDSYFDEPMTLNTEAGNKVFPEYIVCDSNSDEPLTLNLATSTIANDTFNIQYPIFSDYPYLDELTTREF